MEVYLLCIQNTKTDQKVAFQNDNNFWCKPKYILTVKWQKSNIKPSIYKLTGRASSIALIKFVIFVPLQSKEGFLALLMILTFQNAMFHTHCSSQTYNSKSSIHVENSIASTQCNWC